MNNVMISLYDSSNNLVGYFHNNKELEEYISFLENRNISTKDWKSKEFYFE